MYHPRQLNNFFFWNEKCYKNRAAIEVKKKKLNPGPWLKEHSARRITVSSTWFHSGVTSARGITCTATPIAPQKSNSGYTVRRIEERLQHGEWKLNHQEAFPNQRPQHSWRHLQANVARLVFGALRKIVGGWRELRGCLVERRGKSRVEGRVMWVFCGATWKSRVVRSVTRQSNTFRKLRRAKPEESSMLFSRWSSLV